MVMRVPKLWMRLQSHDMFLMQGIMNINSVGTRGLYLLEWEVSRGFPDVHGEGPQLC